jgi:acyl dehydratase
MTIGVGHTETFTRSFTQKDFDRFARLTRDNNPIHVDPDFSARTRFGRTVAHGMMLYSTICSGLVSRFPGPGTLQIQQEMIFRHPTYTDTQIEVRLEVTEEWADLEMAAIKTTVHLPDGNLACDGKTMVHYPGWRGGFSRCAPEKKKEETIKARTLKRLSIGQTATARRIFKREDLDEYADLTGDGNPLFSDPEAGQHVGFEGCIIPGPLLSGMFSDLLGTRLPGRGTNWLKQKLDFPAPAYLNEEIAATVEITRLRPNKNLVNLSGTCRNPAGETVCRAQSLVLVKDLEGELS